MDDMQVILAADPRQMGQVAAELAAKHLRQCLEWKERVRIVVATGASQFEVLEQLIEQPDIDWSRVEGFHLDEYVGLSSDHEASFCRYLKERFVGRVPLAAFHFLHGDEDVSEVMSRVGDEIGSGEVDLLLCGIGENAHLAFNDPPADFETETPYLKVLLDEACRQQQVGEGWFASLAEVPTHAMSMSIGQILKSKRIICSVPDERKSAAVRATLEDPVSPMVPASILRDCDHVTFVIDEPAASKLSEQTLAGIGRA